MKKLTVKVISSRATYWYAGAEGETYDVYRFGSTYVVASDYDEERGSGHPLPWRHLRPEDVEIIE